MHTLLTNNQSGYIQFLDVRPNVLGAKIKSQNSTHSIDLWPGILSSLLLEIATQEAGELKLDGETVTFKVTGTAVTIKFTDRNNIDPDSQGVCIFEVADLIKDIWPDFAVDFVLKSRGYNEPY